MATITTIGPSTGMDHQDYLRQYAALRALLRSLRAEAGVSQVELAKRLGVPQSFVSKIESGERRIDVIELRRICVALECSLLHLISLFERDLSSEE